MPRFVFVKSGVGEKPVFVDFDSPLSIDLLARAVRNAAGTPALVEPGAAVG